MTDRKRALGAATAAILTAIRDGRRHGLDIMRATGRPSGTVYATLSRMEERGLVRGKWEEQDIADREGRPRRRYYQLTDRGLVELNETLALFSSLAGLGVKPTPLPDEG